MSGAIHLVEGYASLFGLTDLCGDVVWAGAFARTLRNRTRFPLYLEHDPRLLAGAWTHLEEDHRGLFVRGEIDLTAPAGAMALRRVRAGIDGLSIGFQVDRSRARGGEGRDLLQLSLFEISLVRTPMLPQARLHRRTEALQSLEL